jgi:hypothetical protein
MSRWYRAYEGTVTDPKLGEAAMIAGVSRSVSIAAWHCLLESAAGRNNCGSFDATPRRVAVILCEPLAQVEALFVAYAELGLIAESSVTSWKRRQYESDSSTERSRKHRNAKRNGSATLQQQDATPPDTDTETETEVSEPKGSSPRAWSLPAGVNLITWTDFLTNRKRKRLVNTESTWKTFQDDLARVSAQTGIPPPKLIEQCTGKGWGGIYDPREDGNGQSGQQRMGRHQSSDGISSTARAGLAVFGSEASH